VSVLAATPNCGLIAGHVDVFARQANRPTAVEVYEFYNAFPQDEYVEKHHFGATANVFTYRAVIEHVGDFNTDLFTTYGEDYDWGVRVYNAGYAQQYAPDVRIAHPARRTLGELHRRNLKILRSNHVIRLQNNQPIKWYIREIIRSGLIPNVRELIRIYTGTSPTGLVRKTQYAAVILFLRYTTAFERLRLFLSARRNTT
jgi:GT2 family glycosyltransferase